MTKPWETDSCEQVQSYYTVYPVPVAAALWCRIEPGDVDEHLRVATQVHRAIYRHPYIKCLEPRCRALHEAIEKGVLPVSRENGKSFDGSREQVAPERRHVNRSDLKEWIAREFPADKPPFLFDEIERTTHAAINADVYQALQADRDALKTRIDKAEEWARQIIAEKNALARERDSLMAMVENGKAPGPRAETTYLNIIGGLLELICNPRPGRNSEATVIRELVDNYSDKPGISKATLEARFADAKRSLLSSN